MNKHTNDLDTFVSRRSALAAIDFDIAPESPPHGFPLVAVCMFGTGLALLLLWYYGNKDLFFLQLLGIAFLGFSGLSVVFYRADTRAKIGKMMSRFSPALDELRQLQRELKLYLKQLDERTSRYFHAVTNTKVTTYFMLQQIEASIEELASDLEHLMQQSTAKNYRKMNERFRGVIRFRDGLQRNMGNEHEISVIQLTSHVQALAHQLEAGVSELESDIERYNRMVKRGEGFPDPKEIHAGEKKDLLDTENLLKPKGL